MYYSYNQLNPNSGGYIYNPNSRNSVNVLNQHQMMYPTGYNLTQEYYSQVQDHGKQPFVFNINEATKYNNTFRSAVWTGDHLQVTLMSINPGEDIGLEMHPDVD
ncbi:cupin domain-containing protein, partial [Terribacillus saccharophilus]